MAGVIGNANKSKAGLMSDLQFKAIFGGKGGNDTEAGKFMRFDMDSTRASILLQTTQNTAGSSGLYSLVVNGYDAPKLKALNVGTGSSTIEFFYKRDPSSLKTSILIKSSRDYSTVYSTSPEEIRFIGLEDSSNGYTSLIPKVDVFGYNTLEELAAALKPLM